MVNAENPRREVSDFLFYISLLFPLQDKSGGAEYFKNKNTTFVKTLIYANLYYTHQHLYRT
jgi:hypothetical protein